jgi:hypothetical protein
VVGSSRVRELEARLCELERLLGHKRLEVEVLKEALAAARGQAIRQLTDSRPTYDYRRITALLNRARRGFGRRIRSSYSRGHRTITQPTLRVPKTTRPMLGGM